MEFSEVIKSRFSVRSFDSRKVGREKIENILKAAQSAPSAKNMQPVRIFCAQSDEALEKLSKLSPCIYGAPLVFIVCSDENACWVSPEGKSRGEMDASISATHIMLAAADEGLGSCWVCMFDAKRLVKEFELPENLVPQCLMLVGYPAPDARPSERHFDRLPLSQTVKYL